MLVSTFDFETELCNTNLAFECLLKKNYEEQGNSLEIYGNSFEIKHGYSWNKKMTI